MAGLLTAFLLAYIGPVKGYLDQRSELRDQTAKLAQLEQRRDALRAQLRALGRSDVLEARARALGLVRPGERAFIVSGSLEPTPPARTGGGHDGGPLGWLTNLF